MLTFEVLPPGGSMEGGGRSLLARAALPGACDGGQGRPACTCLLDGGEAGWAQQGGESWRRRSQPEGAAGGED